jgi:hypothetical protein
MSLQEYKRLSAEHVGFWAAYSDFLKDVNLAELNIEPEVFAGVRSPEPSRRLDFSIAKNGEPS